MNPNRESQDLIRRLVASFDPQDGLNSSSLSDAQWKAMDDIVMGAFNMASVTADRISEIKKGGHEVLLEDGTRWEVDEYDAETAKYWEDSGLVLVMDDQMYRVDESEYIRVTKE